MTPAETTGPEDAVDAAAQADTEAKRTPGQALLNQMGGLSGLIYSALPVAVLVPVSTAFGLLPAICAALGVALAILVWRLIRHDSVQPALAGFFGVGVSALIAWLVGASKGYFLLGIWTSLIWAASSCIRAGRSYPVGRGPSRSSRSSRCFCVENGRPVCVISAALRAPADSAAINKSSRASAPMVARCSANSPSW